MKARSDAGTLGSARMGIATGWREGGGSGSIESSIAEN